MQNIDTEIQKPTSARAFHLKWTIAPLVLGTIVLVLIRIFGDSHDTKVAVGTIWLAQAVYFIFDWPGRYFTHLQERDEFLNSVGIIPFLKGITREDAGDSASEIYEAFAREMPGNAFENRGTTGQIDGILHSGAVLLSTKKLRVKVKSVTAMEYFQMLPGDVRKRIELVADYELQLQ
jgi:hypothetical protein